MTVRAFPPWPLPSSQSMLFLSLGFLPLLYQLLGREEITNEKRNSRARNGRNQRRLRRHGRHPRHRRQRYRQSCCVGSGLGHCGHAGFACLEE